MTRLALLFGALAALNGAPALADAPPTAPAPTPAAHAEAGYRLYVCETDQATRLSFERQYGTQVFMTAEEVLSAHAEGKAWQGVRCITSAELERLERLQAMASR